MLVGKWVGSWSGSFDMTISEYRFELCTSHMDVEQSGMLLSPNCASCLLLASTYFAVWQSILLALWSALVYISTWWKGGFWSYNWDQSSSASQRRCRLATVIAVYTFWLATEFIWTLSKRWWWADTSVSQGRFADRHVAGMVCKVPSVKISSHCTLSSRYFVFLLDAQSAATDDIVVKLLPVLPMHKFQVVLNLRANYKWDDYVGLTAH